jgi:type I restriction enzyme, S subunit
MVYNESKYNLDWEVKPLNKLGDFKRGKSKHRPRNDKKLFYKGSYPLIQTGEIKAANLFVRLHNEMYNDFGLKQSKLWPANTLCITIAANIAETALLGYPMCFPDSVVGFNAFPKESSEIFMHYVFTYVKKTIQKAASGSIQDNINVEYLTSLKFRIPEKKYQNQIIDILSSLDSKIELNNRINAELEAMAKTIYDYWFVQFDFPDKNGKPYKSSGGKMVWNEELRREIPEGWEIKSLFTIADVQYGFPFSTEFFNIDGNGSPVIRIRDILENSISNYSTEKNTDKKYQLESGDVLVGMDGNFHINYWSKENCYLNQRIVRIRKKELANIFIRYQIEPYIQLREKSVSRTTVGHLSDKDLKAIQIIVPEKQTKNLINTLFDNFLKKLTSNHQQNQQLSSLRDWLLPMLMNGQVTVGKAYEHVEEVLSMVAEDEVEYKKKSK